MTDQQPGTNIEPEKKLIENCNLHIALAEVGRIGKSTLIKCLAEYLTKQNTEYLIVDTDRANPDVAKGYMPDFLSKWQNAPEETNGKNSKNAFAPLSSDEKSEDNSVEELLKEQIYFTEDSRKVYLMRRLLKLTKLSSNLLVNIPANVYQEVISFLKSNSVLTMPKVKLFNWWVSDGSHKSLDLFLETKLMFPDAHHILVLNQGRSDLIIDFNSYRWPSSLGEKYRDPKYKTSEIKTIPLPLLPIDLNIWYAKDTTAHREIINDPLVDEFDLIAIKAWQDKVFKSIEKIKLV
jgi:hypothetical protein